MKKILSMLSFFISMESVLIASLVKPANGSTINYIHVLFEWEQEPDAVYYTLQVADNMMFDNPIADVNDSTLLFNMKDNIDWGSTYYWRVRPFYREGDFGDWIDTLLFSVGESKCNIDTDIVNYDLVQSGLNIVSNWMWPNNSFICAFDTSGNEVWNDGELNITMTNIDKYGQIYGSRKNINLPYSEAIAMDLNGEIIWNNGGVIINPHDFIPLTNGNYMGFVPISIWGPIPLGSWTAELQARGFIADGVTEEVRWKGTKIIEWDAETKEEVWEWNSFDHYTIDDFDAIGGSWSWGLDGIFYDWMHTNSIYFDQNESAIYLSDRHISRITKIAYPSGEIVWRIGLSSEYMSSGDEHICTDLLFSFQHHVQLLDNGHLLFFDNGNLSNVLFDQADRTSRVLEILVHENSYCEVIWEYELPQELYGRYLGSAQLLNNGNYLINTGGDNGTILEVTPDKQEVYLAQLNQNIYRAFRIPSIHPDAVSIIADGLTTIKVDELTINGIVLSNLDKMLKITIFNESGYNHQLHYSLHDEENYWFRNIYDTIFLEAYDDTTLFFKATFNEKILSTVNFTYEYLPHKENVINWNVYKKVPETFVLNQNYPNPFNTLTNLRYDLPELALVRLTIYDIMGREITRIVNTTQSGGYRTVQWDATNSFGEPVSTGVYLYQIQAGEFIQTKKMVLLK